MNREIKFRGIDKRGIWHYGYLWETPSGDFMIRENITKTHSADFEVITESIGQFTGLFDKNGKEIYEGDIIKWYYNSDEEHKQGKGSTFIAKVIYKIMEKEGDLDVGTFHCGFMIEWINEEGEDEQYKFSDLPNPENTKIEIIGNIYENPELMKK